MLRRVVAVIVVLTLAATGAIATGLVADRYFRNQALADAFARLRLFHELRRASLQDLLNSMASDVQAASENARVVDAMETLTYAWPVSDARARDALRRLYAEESQFPPKERYKLEDAGDGSRYSNNHRDFHIWVNRFREHFGYYDVFLINIRGDILYSVAKESDFATNLKTGPYRTSPLADVFRRVMAAPGASVRFSDFAAYPPSNNAPAAFAGHAIRKGEQLLGVFAVQIPAEPLNELMRFTAGMGATGETYLVGADGLMRSQSRFSAEPTLLKTRVESPSVGNALNGTSGAQIVEDYRGIPVLSVYAPFDFGSQSWVLLAEIDEAEVLGKTQPEIVFIVAAIAGLLAAALALLAWRLSNIGRGARPQLTSTA